MTSAAPSLPVTAADVRAAHERLRGHAVRTPLLEVPALNAAAGGRVLVKCENLQREGSFKYRGAFNRLVQIAPAERARGVVAWSSGNHAQGVAAAARDLGMPAAIVMPSDAPAVKMDNTRALGAEVVPYDRRRESREDIARRLCAERGAVLVPSFDDVDVIAGQGTAGLEIVEQACGTPLDQVLVCCGGGGLVAGIALAVKATSADTAVYAVEPAGYDDHARSLVSGRREKADTSRESLCDALLAPSPGEITFAINQRLLQGGLVVSDDEVRAAMRFAFLKLKLVVEPGGAVALAALLAGKLPTAQRTTVVVLSGGNVDGALFAQVLADGR
jgi:threonine dehydratase